MYSRQTNKTCWRRPTFTPAFLFSLSTTLALLSFLRPALAAVAQYRVRPTGQAIEISFTILGRAPRWHLSGHQQELWLDLDHTNVADQAEQPFGAAVFPLAGISVRNMGGLHARVVIRVRGKIDYVVAQINHQLVVRIAAAELHTNLAEPLLADDRTRQPNVSPATVLSDGTMRRSGSRPVRHLHVGTSPNSTDNTTTSALAAVGGPELSTVNVDGSGTSTMSVASLPVPAASPPAVLRPVAITPPLPPTRAHRLVAIDAGHGGFDPGTESADGVAEKNVALAIARALASALEARGVDTQLTRDDDQFLSLAQRTKLANYAHADLFVSVHLNSSPNINTTGIETYYLNNTTDRATIRLARLENGAEYGTPGEHNLNYILTNLRQDYKANEAASLARMIEAESATAVDAELGVQLNALGAKMGPFYVLVGAEMPSALVECGFLSNPREAELLSERRYQQALADGISSAIIRYFNSDSNVGNL